MQANDIFKSQIPPNLASKSTNHVSISRSTRFHLSSSHNPNFIHVLNLNFILIILHVQRVENSTPNQNVFLKTISKFLKPNARKLKSKTRTFSETHINKPPTILQCHVKDRITSIYMVYPNSRYATPG